MKSRYLRILYLTTGLVLAIATLMAAADVKPVFQWSTVVNNNDLIPPLDARHFNSYNQPSVNSNGLVVIRARSRGGPPLGQPIHGIYTRDMSDEDSEIIRIIDKSTRVPQPNNLGARFVETPSFPRIDMESATIATRGSHGPAWQYSLGDGSETRGGTTGIYVNPFGTLITGASKLGDVPGLRFFEVPEFNGVRFEVFPGAPAITGGDTIVFKGNYTAQNVPKTGVYFRQLDDDVTGGSSTVVLIANNTDSLIPGTNTIFGSTAPPSAAGNRVVFAGFDNEDAPALGGIYMAPLQFQPPLTPLVEIGERVQGESVLDTFTGLGEGGAFDGRYVGFWGSWGGRTETVRLYCAEEGNSSRIAYCNNELVCAATGETIGDSNSVCDDTNDPNYGQSCYQEKEVPVNQGIFVHDTRTGRTRKAAKTGSQFDEFLFWNYSGKTPCAGTGHSVEGAADDGEPVRWRSSAYVAISARAGATFNVAFKARTGDLVDGTYTNAVDGIYLSEGPGKSPIAVVIDTTMAGNLIDPEAPLGSLITELGLEREGLRGNWLTINATMSVEGNEEEDGMAGIYITRIR